MTGELQPAIPPAAIEGARRVCTLVDVAHRVAQILEAAILEEVWELDRLVPAAQWEEFVARHLPFDLRTASAMAETWEVARERRDIRELAQSRPSEALDLIRQSIDAGVRIEDATDAEVVAILAKPPKQRSAAIRGLLEAAPPAAEKAPTAPPDPELQRVRPLVEEARRVASEASGLRMDAEVVLASPTPASARQELLRWTDAAASACARVAELARDAE